MVTCKQAASALARCGKARTHPRPLKGTAKRKRRFTLLDDDPDEPLAVQTPTQGKRVNARRIVPVPVAPSRITPAFMSAPPVVGNMVQFAADGKPKSAKDKARESAFDKFERHYAELDALDEPDDVLVTMGRGLKMSRKERRGMAVRGHKAPAKGRSGKKRGGTSLREWSASPQNRVSYKNYINKSAKRHLGGIDPSLFKQDVKRRYHANPYVPYYAKRHLGGIDPSLFK